MPAPFVFVLSLLTLMLAGRTLAVAGRAMGLPEGLVSVLESLALR